MAYKVRIDIGRGKNRTVTESTPLSNKDDVARWVKKNPVGNSNTQVRVKNTSTGEVMTGRKIKFKSPSRF